MANARAGLEQVTSQPVDVSRLQKQVDDARVVFDESLKKAVASGQAGALVGKQSMYLDAATGRRIVQNTLPGLKAVPRGTRISFQLRILEDNHVNFQLAKNTRSGLTALYVAFAGGKISSYRPNSYSEFAAATHDFAAGENHFHVSLEIDPGKDTVALSVKLAGADGFLVRNVPLALNGWNPTKNPDRYQGPGGPGRGDRRETEVRLGFRTPEIHRWRGCDGHRGLDDSPAVAARSDVGGVDDCRL